MFNKMLKAVLVNEVGWVGIASAGKSGFHGEAFPTWAASFAAKSSSSSTTNPETAAAMETQYPGGLSGERFPQTNGSIVTGRDGKTNATYRKKTTTNQNVKEILNLKKQTRSRNSF